MKQLSDYRVVEMTTNIAGPYCAKLFVDAGADVIKVEPPEGDPMRRRAVHGERLGDRDSALFRYLNAGKSSVIATPGDELLERLLADADVLIEDFVPSRLDIDGLRRRHPTLVIVSITPYGRIGPWADRPANDFIVQAESGGLATKGDPQGTPHQVGGRLSEYIAGTSAAVSAMIAARHAKMSGAGEWLDCAMVESTNITFNVFDDLRASLSDTPITGPPGRIRELPSIEPTLDGWVGFNTNTAAQWESFLILIGHAELIGDPEWAGLRRYKHAQQLSEMVRGYTTTVTTAEIIETAALLRIPVAPVGNGQTVLEFDHFRERGFYVASPDGDFVHPLPPYAIDGQRRHPQGPAPGLGAHTSAIFPSARSATRHPVAGELPLEGLRVIDATAWWAGPSMTQILACFGAEVIHVESTTRVDGARTAVGKAPVEGQWYERAPLWLGANANKRDVTLALDHPKGRAAFERLVATADVLVENYAPRVFDNFGLTWELIHQLNPSTIFVRMPAFGLSGPWRDRVGFAQTMEQLSGMAWVTGDSGGEPRIPLGPCDPNAGMHAAFALLVALAQRDRTGEGCYVEATMAEAALNAAAEQPIVHSAHGITITRNGNRSPDAAPQGLYRCNDPCEKWLALSIETDDQWVGLRTVVGRSDWADLPELGTAEGRRRYHDHLDDVVAEWARNHEVAEAVELLVAAGVPAGEVRDPRLAHQHPLLQQRQYFRELEHPIAGRHLVPSPPFRPHDASYWLRSSAPTLGRDSREMLRSVGLSDEEIDELIELGVTGTAP